MHPNPCAALQLRCSCVAVALHRESFEPAYVQKEAFPFQGKNACKRSPCGKTVDSAFGPRREVLDSREDSLYMKPLMLYENVFDQML